MLLLSLTGAILIMTALCLLFFIRNAKASELRLRLMKENYEAFKKLPSYEDMLYRFWIPLTRFEEKATGEQRKEES
ncbi:MULTISPECIES: hypothetical protein [Hahella]|uniref:Uncharacterized protein n=1 Tax=Hahella chejuensis (strain KCTC 2396) TaxID=349521 RepID=Q2SEA1_HAHCH|nr:MULTISPECIES: hypothetical protein [Hahella]ABC31023.1 hypothetical protein HCH_04316 [Hahella chejuensis KCTC 2396]AZZ93206.1 hypothetical protein ENC22_19190 [Hahella sp. KA22]MBU6954969.1 hypothetical protein [Hahella sp. HN01]MDG9668081.1 hypothetical protein [Hahella sp. CR1]QAY56579.1 hypothetical protein EUZ85_21770 [Hahella sp. KA22]